MPVRCGWRDNGPARRKLRDRIDKGVKGPLRAAGAAADGGFKTEAAFIRKRVADVRELHVHWVKDGKRRGAAERVRDAAAELWTDEMEDEVNFQRTKRQKRLVDAVRENQVLPKERDAGLDAAARAAAEQEAGARLRGGGVWQASVGRLLALGTTLTPGMLPFSAAGEGRQGAGCQVAGAAGGAPRGSAVRAHQDRGSEHLLRSRLRR
jgi:hypothetical protein